MDALLAIKSRHSVRKYSTAEIPLGLIEDIVDCGRLAPCGYNNQDWMFIAATDRGLLRSIAARAEYGRFIGEAGACIAVFSKRGEETMIEDACAATENMIIAAQAYGVGSCWVNSFRKKHSEEVMLLLGCPDSFELVTLLALGYPAEEGSTPPPKKALSEVLRINHF